MDSSNPNISIGCGDITHENLREAIEEFSGLEIALAYDSDFPPQEGNRSFLLACSVRESN